MKSSFSQKYSVLIQKITFTILALLIYRTGSFVPVPEIDVSKIPSIFNYTSSGIFGMFNMLSGGSLSRMSIFALSIVPYITASIVVQLASSLIPQLKQIKQEGQQGQIKLTQYTKYLTILIACFQSYAIARSIGAAGMYLGESEFGSHYQRFIVCLTLTTGVLTLIWLGKQISSHGIGNGISLIIFTGIVAEFPSIFISFFELAKTGVINPLFLVLVIAIFVISIGIIVLVERSYRMVPVTYSRAFQANRFGGGTQMQKQQTNMPLKINQSGVIPPIFASSVLLLPATIATFFQSSQNPILQWISLNIVHGKPLFIVLYLSCIIFFTFFYTGVVFDVNETADQLKKSSALVQNVRPGPSTANYLKGIVNRLAFLGSMYLCVICLIPEIFASYNSIAVMLGGTSLLILVNVSTDTISQVRLLLLPKKYEKLTNQK